MVTGMKKMNTDTRRRGDAEAGPGRFAPASLGEGVGRVLTLWAVLLLAGCGSSTAAGDAAATQRVTLDGERFELELASTPEARYQGLSDRGSIPEHGGMLFVFPQPGLRAFVMRKCLTPIDLVFLDAGGRIVAMHEMAVEPYDTPSHELKRYWSEYPAQFAIELRGGWLERLELETGEKVELPLEALKARAE